MKSKLHRMLAAGLAALLLWASAGFAAPGDAVLNKEASLSYESSMAVVGDTLYMLRTGIDLTCYKIGDEQPTLLMDFTTTGIEGEAIEPANRFIDELQKDRGEAPRLALRYLVSSDNALYALDQQFKTLWKYYPEKKAFGQALSINAEKLFYSKEIGRISQISRIVLSYDTLFMMCDESDDGIRYQRLVRLPLQGGELKLIKENSSIRDYCLYQPGKLIVRTEDEDGERMALGIYDLSSGQIEEKLVLPAESDIFAGYHGLVYDLSSDSAFLQSGAKILRSVQFGALETVAYLPSKQFNYFEAEPDAHLLAGGYYAAALSDCFAVRHLDQAYLPDRTLKLPVMYVERMKASFEAQYPEVVTEYEHKMFSSTEEFVNEINNPTGGNDVYCVDLRFIDIKALVDKGYIADLSSNPALNELASGMYPNVQRAIRSGDKLAAIPVSYSAQNVMGVRPELFAELGIAEADIPETFMEMLNFIEVWAAEHAKAHPDMMLFNEVYGTTKSWMAQKIITQQMLACRFENRPLEIDTPEIRALFQKMDQMNWRAIPTNGANEEQLNGKLDVRSLFVTQFASDAQTFGLEFGLRPLPLSIEAGGTGYLDVDMQALVISPHAADFAPAVQYLEFIAANYSPAMRANLMTDANEPVPNPDIDSTIAFFEHEIEQLEKTLEIAEGAEKTSIQAQIDSTRDEMEGRMQNVYTLYSVSPAQIEMVRAMQHHNVVMEPIPFYNDQHHEAYSTLFARYTDGQINGDAFIDEFAQKLRMIELEG